MIGRCPLCGQRLAVPPDMDEIRDMIETTARILGAELLEQETDVD